MTASTATRRATWLSPAKVNLCLRVVGRRADGYHVLDSVFAAVDLCDEIEIDAVDVRPGVAPTCEVRSDRADVPASDDNLAARAARAVLDERDMGGRIVLRLRKRIPPGAGLGGGSGNAATVLRRLNELLDLGIAPGRLRELALGLGADVPFFLSGGMARVRGIGESVEPILFRDDLHLVLAVPPFGVSTAWAFGAYARSGVRPSEGDEAARLAAGASLDQRLMVNDLEDAVFAAYPAIATVKRAMLAAGAGAAVMSGSGSTIVGLADSAAAARAIAASLGGTHPDVAVHAVTGFRGE